MSTTETPGVVPEPQDWTGRGGRFAVTASVQIQTDASCARLAEAFVVDLHRYAGIGARLDDAAVRGPVIRLRITAVEATVVAPTAEGVFYGTRSILQMLLANPGGAMPCGSMVDWPDYRSRGFLFDVGWCYVFPEFLRECLRVLAFFKFNEFQIHFNDNAISTEGDDVSSMYSGFRLASENPELAGLASEDGAYNRQDWESFEDLAAAQAITIVPEIDGPAHAGRIIAWKPEIALDGGRSEHLDLSNPEATETMLRIIDEFLPWFRSQEIHFGADEYPRDHRDEFREYYNTMAAHLRRRGRRSRAWGASRSCTVRPTATTGT